MKWYKGKVCRKKHDRIKERRSLKKKKMLFSKYFALKAPSGRARPTVVRGPLPRHNLRPEE